MTNVIQTHHDKNGAAFVISEQYDGEKSAAKATEVSLPQYLAHSFKVKNQQFRFI